MNMKRLLTLVAFFATLQASAQQVNPVPDYVFANRMSAGRNTVTDTAAYFSIGPRYGATRGMMPPMVVDTASFSANKRNGLLIFSVQKNKFLYWDSVGVKWAEMAGTGGSAITGSGVSGYMPEFTTTTNLDTTRLYHSSGRFVIGSTTTTNGVFNVYGGQSYFDTSLKVGSQTFLADESKDEVYVNTTGDSGAYRLQVNGAALVTSHSMPIATFISPFADNSIYITNIGSNDTARTLNHAFRFRNTSGAEYSGTIMQSVRSASSNATRLVFFTTSSAASSAAERVRIDPDGNMGIGTPGTYFAKLQVNSSGTGARDVLILENTASAATGNGPAMTFAGTGTAGMAIIRSLYESSAGTDANLQFFTRGSGSVAERIRIFGNGRVFIGSTPTDGGYQLDVNGTMKATSLSTSAPSGGSIKPWKIGEAATVSPTSPNRTIRVEIDGTVYYLHAKTTND